ncbi:hypothetical protein LJC49_07045 [Ruminococcaceae bacterium OttesenSCG-928-I18]|nr:hypothetical protein [Ruminococcaceae bacterium OttesenSCG-928-I18]
MTDRKCIPGNLWAKARGVACVMLAVVVLCLSTTTLQAAEPGQDAAGKEREEYLKVTINPRSEVNTREFGLPGQNSLMRYVVISTSEVEMELECFPKGGRNLVAYEKFDNGHCAGYVYAPYGQYVFNILNHSTQKVTVEMWVKTIT